MSYREDELKKKHEEYARRRAEFPVSEVYKRLYNRSPSPTWNIDQYYDSVGRGQRPSTPEERNSDSESGTTSRRKNEAKLKKSKKDTVHHRKNRSHTSSSESSESEYEWVERVFENQKDDMIDDSDSDCGPVPLPSSLAPMRTSYGHALLRGEGDAMASYVQSGARIPRRGEVGISADDIDKLEDLGYVMSGSRHARMNAIRMRKENQVISAEEQKQMALMKLEERQNREASTVLDLQEMLKKQKEILARTLEKRREGEAELEEE